MACASLSKKALDKMFHNVANKDEKNSIFFIIKSLSCCFVAFQVFSQFIQAFKYNLRVKIPLKPNILTNVQCTDNLSIFSSAPKNVYLTFGCTTSTCFFSYIFSYRDDFLFCFTFNTH